MTLIKLRKFKISDLWICFTNHNALSFCTVFAFLVHRTSSLGVLWDQDSLQKQSRVQRDSILPRVGLSPARLAAAYGQFHETFIHLDKDLWADCLRNVLQLVRIFVKVVHFNKFLQRKGACINKAIRDDRPSLAMTHIWRHDTCFRHNALLTSWRTLMAYFVLSPNGEESLNQFFPIQIILDEDRATGIILLV